MKRKSPQNLQTGKADKESTAERETRQPPEENDQTDNHDETDKQIATIAETTGNEDWSGREPARVQRQTT